MTTLMAAEIAEQPDALARTLEHLLPMREEVRRLSDGCRSILFVARGSSDNAAVYGRYLMETHAGVRAALSAPSVGTHYNASLDLRDVLVVSVSQSGETAEIVETQEWAKGHGARTVAVTNGASSALAEQADLALVTSAGVERAVPATKTYVTQLAAMCVLGTALAEHPEDLDEQLGRVPDEVARLVRERTGVDEAVSALAGSDVMVSGRGLMMGTALEVALKLEETCLRPVRGLSYADLRHGPIAIVSEQLAAVLVAAKDGPMVSGMRQLADDLRTRGIGVIIGIGGGALAEACDIVLGGPDLVEAVAPLAAVVPGQLLAEGLARRLGLDPDAPRGLKKVTQTDTQRDDQPT